MADLVPLQDVLTFTRDGEWGKGEAADDLVKMAVIRGTDFSAVRHGDVSSVPVRYIPKKAADRKMLRPGDILIETAGGTKDQPTGRTVYLDQRVFDALGMPATCASFARFLRVNPAMVDPKYLFWYLQSIYATGEMFPYHIQHTGVARFQYTDFAAQWRVPVPDKDHQIAIAEILSALDDKIELNRRMNETLEAMAQAIFRDWFVDFGPTRRKADGASDPVTIMGGLVTDPDRAKGLTDLFPTRLGDDGLPEGWEKRLLGDDFDVVMGQSPPGSTYNEMDDGLPFFQGRRDFQFRFPEKRVFCSAPTRIAEADWTLVSVRAPVGDINRAWERCCIGRGVGALMHKRGLATFTYHSGLNLKEELATYDKDGTVFGSINQAQLKRLGVAGSNTQAAEAFDAFVGPMDDLIRKRTRETSTLTATRDLLLPKLMSGEIRLRDAGATIEAAQ